MKSYKSVVANRKITRPMPPATHDDKEAIEQYLSWAIQVLESNVRLYGTIPKADRPKFVVRNLEYWKHGLQNMKWLRGINRQRRGV